jgi:hypothetical protein
MPSYSQPGTAWLESWIKILTGQNIPSIDPLKIEKKVSTPKDLAGIQRAKQRMPVRNVMKPAVSILPNLSLRRPVTVQQRKISYMELLVRSDNKVAEIPLLDGESQSETEGTSFVFCDMVREAGERIKNCTSWEELTGSPNGKA